MYPTQLHSYLLWRSSVPPDPQSLASRRHTAAVSLFPATMVGIFVFGWWAGVVTLTSIITAFVVDLVTHKYIYKDSPGTRDGTWMLTGLLIGLMLPPNVPLWVPIFGAALAIFVGKHYLSVDGMPLFQPTIVGLLALHIIGLFAFWFAGSNPMLALKATEKGTEQRWPVLSRSIETSAEAVKEGRVIWDFFGGDVTNSISQKEYNERVFATQEVPAAAVHGPRPLDLVQSDPKWDVSKKPRTNDGMRRYETLDLILGYVPATIGGSSALALGWGILMLIFGRAASWVLPTFALGTMFGALHFIAWVFGSSANPPVIAENIPIHLLTGSTLLGIFYLAADPTTAPRSFLGKVYAGVAVGLIEVFLRTFIMTEGIILSVFIVQGLAIVIDQWLAPPVEEQSGSTTLGLTPSSLGRL